MYEYLMKFSEYLENGMKMQIVFPNGMSFSWYEVFAFEIVASILVYVIAGIIFDD